MDHIDFDDRNNNEDDDDSDDDDDIEGDGNDDDDGKTKRGRWVYGNALTPHCFPTHICFDAFSLVPSGNDDVVQMAFTFGEIVR